MNLTFEKTDNFFDILDSNNKIYPAFFSTNNPLKPVIRYSPNLEDSFNILLGNMFKDYKFSGMGYLSNHFGGLLSHETLLQVSPELFEDGKLNIPSFDLESQIKDCIKEQVKIRLKFINDENKLGDNLRIPNSLLSDESYKKDEVGIYLLTL